MTPIVPAVARVMLALLTAAAMPATASLAADDAPAARRPNILFIYSDDHGEQAISSYGSTLIQTPHIDRLASTGVRFANSFVTNSICGPCRAVVLTGKHSHLNKMTENIPMSFDGSQQTLPKLMQSHGYRTAIIGKWHLKSNPTGFDHWNVLPGQGAYYNPSFDTPGGRIRKQGYVTDVITDMSIEWLDEHAKGDKPWMLFSWHKAPHATYDPAIRHLGLYRDKDLPEPPTLFDDFSGRSGAAKLQQQSLMDLDDRHFHLVPPKGMGPGPSRQFMAAYEQENNAFREAKLAGDDLRRWRFQRYLKDYLRTVASIDENIGRLLDYLQEKGLAENTIVIYSSDQGYFLGEHGWVDKRWMYEPSLRTPLVIRWPAGAKAGLVDRHMVQNLDLAPTLLDAVGAPIPADMQGRSLLPLMRGESPGDWRRSIYYRFYESNGWGKVPAHYGVRTDRHKLIYFSELDKWEMFDLPKDPHELTSVYDDPAYADVRQALTAELARLRQQYQDTDTPRKD